jgi:endonuclease YncB( thermonuclease family)
MKKFIAGILMSLAVVSVAQADFPSGVDVKTEGNVYRVVDGDTFVINVNENGYQKLKSYATGDDLKYFNDQYSSVRVRLASTDTEESKHKDESRNTVAGEEASRHVTQILEKKDVRLACYDFGDYNRIICNVAFPYNGDMADLGAYLMVNDLSDYVTYFGNNPYLHNEYQKIR